MPDVRFVTEQGEIVLAHAASGDRLLKVAQIAGMPLEGTCEGQMACSTCHVIVAPDWFPRLPDPSDEEEDLLDLAAHVTRTSRLACQISVTEDLDGIEVRIPRNAHNLQIG
ncbi:2Fe-2S iron-sulfur cluster-binding protein [Novosphingobium sp. 9]|uniref:2Fe-2S iron-sulfur cluster-binding protein n=1 Tax=Novosphingobium sp. 9 TaxID=2025349 RepID=UPI0021B5F478|nr:2Fe-2S iron-sulfur cluster-binding protein [Novosphingobium sp. 9]